MTTLSISLFNPKSIKCGNFFEINVYLKKTKYVHMYSDMFKLQLVCMARLTINPCECYCAEQYETWNKFLLRLLLFRVRQILTIAYLLSFFPRSIVCTQILQFTLNCKSRNEIIRRLNWTFFYYWGWSNNAILQKDTHTLPNSNCSSPC